MSLRFKTNLLEHAKVIAAWAAKHQATATIDVATMGMTLRHGSKTAHLTPQFVGTRPDGLLAYFPQATNVCNGFVGWLPYPVQQWSISTSKLEFKQTMRRVGLATPAAWTDGQEITEDYIIKKDRSAFGYGIQGPFRPPSSQNLPPKLNAGEYAEAFKVGQIARAWYWSSTLVCLEAFEMPRTRCDGRSTLQALLMLQLGSAGSLPTGTDALMAWQGFALSDSPPKDLEIISDYRYVSVFNPTLYQNSNRVHELAGTMILDQLRHAGVVVNALLPDKTRPLGFVLDAIIDKNERVWLLEVNSNPQLHPDVYPAMLASMLSV
jgi:hypothetical protein